MVVRPGNTRIKFNYRTRRGKAQSEHRAAARRHGDRAVDVSRRLRHYLVARGAHPTAAARLAALARRGRRRLCCWPWSCSRRPPSGRRPRRMPASHRRRLRGSPLKISVSMLSSLETATVASGIAPPEEGRVNVGLGYGRATNRNSFEISLGSVSRTDGRPPGPPVVSGAISFIRARTRTVFEVIESASTVRRQLSISGYTPALRVPCRTRDDQRGSPPPRAEE